MADKNFYCKLCDRTLHSESEFDQHCNGKKHKSNEQLAHDYDIATRKLFVRGHDGMENPASFLHTYFMNFGRVENISFGGRNGCSYAIVEFRDKDSVTRALRMRHRIGGFTLYVKQYQHRAGPYQVNKNAQQKLEQDEKAKQAQAKDGMLSILLSASSVADQINLLAQNLKLDISDQKARAQICAELKKLFVPHFGNCTIYQFGSSVNGFGAKGCDLDLFLDLTDQNSLSTPSKSKVKKLGQIISTSPHFTNSLIIPSQRCPVVRFCHKQTEIKCDLSINNRKALHNSYLLRLYSSEPRVHKLVSTVRLWAKYLELAGSAGGAHLFTSYSITLIVLFFVMQRKPRMVPLVCDIEKCVQGTRREMVDDCECISVPVDAQLPPSENKETDLDLVKEFFTFYSSTIDWDRDALVMKDATIFPRNTISLNPDYIGCKAAFMTLLDPFVLTHNVLGNVNAKTKERFVAELKRAAQLTSSWSEVAQTPGPSAWGIAALLIPAPVSSTNIPGSKQGHKGKQLEAKSQDPARDGPAKNNANLIEGEQESGDFYITVQPHAQTMLSPQLMSAAKCNNVKPAEQWCITAQDLILTVLQTVFMIEVEELVAERKEEVCLSVDLTGQQEGERLSEGGGSKDHCSVPGEEKCDSLVKECPCLDNSPGSREIECDVQAGGYGKRTSDAAQLDGNIVELMNACTSDPSTPPDDKVLNPKKRFCEGVTVKKEDIVVVNQVIGTSEGINNTVINKNVDEKHNSVLILDESRISIGDQYSRTVSEDLITDSHISTEDNVPATSSAESVPSTTITPSTGRIESISHPDTLSEINKVKTASYFCRCKKQLWIGRKKMSAELSKRQSITALEFEQEISNFALRKQSELMLHQEMSKVQMNVAEDAHPGHPLARDDRDKNVMVKAITSGQNKDSPTAAQSCRNNEQIVEFSCQILHKNFDTDVGLPHIVVKLRQTESSSNQFKNFYCSFRALILNLIMKHFLEVYK